MPYFALANQSGSIKYIFKYMNSKPTEVIYFDKLKRLLKDFCLQVFKEGKLEFLTFHIQFTGNNFKITLQ